MSRIAYLSPMPPEASGIADYSVELLTGLRHRFDIDVFSATGTLPAALASLAARPYGSFAAAERARPYEAVVYQVGNDAAYHREIYRQLLQRPGILVLHEYMLHHLIRGLGRRDEYVETMRYCYGTPGVGLAERLLELDDSEERWSYPLFERAVDASQGVIVHSDATKQRVLRSRPGARVAVVPHHLSLEALPPVDDASRRTLRVEMGIPDDTLIVASFGRVTQAKRIDVALRAFARMRRHHPNAVYLLAGQVSPYYADLPRLLAGPLGERVIVTGEVPLPRLLALMDLCDVAVNLRHPTGGETSGTCVRLLGLGTPVIVSTGDWFSDIPDGCCARVEPGRFEEEELCAVLDALVADPQLRGDMGVAAGAWARRHHALERSVEGYAAFIDETIRAAPRVDTPVPPLAPYAPGDVGVELMADVAGAAAELGVPDDDALLLPGVASTLVDLGLTGADE